MSITTVLKDKKLEDLVLEETVKGSNLIEPTDVMIGNVLTRLKAGESHKEIKRAVKKQGTNLTLSYDQIEEIAKARAVKIVELTPCAICGKAPCVCVKEVPEEITKV